MAGVNLLGVLPLFMIISSAEFFQLLVVGCVLLLVVTAFVRVSMRLRRGGGSLTTTVLGATDGFLSQEKSKAAEIIVDRNAGKTKKPVLPTSGKKPGSGAQ
jgi:hypothetical protein